jgi:hypothetical protein
LSNDWTTLQFAFRGEVYDLIGKSVADLGSGWTAERYSASPETLEGSMQATFALTPPGVTHPSGLGLVTVQVTNPEQAEIPAEEAPITAIQMDSDRLLLVGETNPMSPTDGFILAGGLVTYDKETRAKELYGEPNQEEVDGLKDITYISGDVMMSLTVAIDSISSMRLENTAEPEFLVRQREAVEADQQDDMGEDAYINVAGFKLTMDTPFTEFAEAVELYEPYEPKGDMKWQVDEIIAPQDEMTFSGRLRGYGSTSLYLRLFNPGTEAIKANDSLIIGIQIKNSYDSFARTPHHAPVSGPFNVRMGEPFKEAMDKIPDDALEKEFPEEGGAYATYDAHGMRYLAVASPEDGWSEDLNHMSLTVMR